MVMEIVVGLCLFSAGLAMVSKMYIHCVHPHHPSCAIKQIKS